MKHRNPTILLARPRTRAARLRAPQVWLPLLLGAAACLLALATRADTGADPDRFECVVMPYRVLDLSSGVSGRLASVAVDRADRVSAGQVLAELESRVERANLALARARASMRSERNLRAAGHEFDQRREARLDSLHAVHAVSVQEKEDVERAARIGQWQVAVAEDNLRLAALEARRAEALLELRRVTAPFDGVVVERFKSPGEYVDEEAVLRIAQLDPLRVEVIVPIERYGEFAAGLVAQVYPETAADHPWRARVVAVDPVGDPASGTFRARLEVPNPDQSHLAGIKCQAALGAPPVAPVEQIADAPANVTSPPALAAHHGASR